MSNDFVAEILRATGTLRAGDPAGATDIIRASLAAGGLAPGATRTAGQAPAGAQAAAGGGASLVGDRSPRRQAGPGGLRRSLGETIRSLSARPAMPSGALAGRPMPAAEPVPEGASFRDMRFSCDAGERRYRLYVPASAAAGLRGMVVMLHGCTQSPEDFAAGTGMNAVAEANRLVVVYPAQTNRDNAMSCWNWFRPGDQRRDAGEPAIIAGLTRAVRDEFSIPTDRVFVAGLSAGGAMAAIMGETYPELYAGIGVHSGLAYASASDVPSAFSAMKGDLHRAVEVARGVTGSEAPRVIVFHGSADRTVHPENARRIIASRGVDPARVMRTDHAATDGRHGYSTLVLPDSAGAKGVPALECWMIDGADHAWSGGSNRGSYTDPRGPDASAEIARFFLAGAEGGR